MYKLLKAWNWVKEHWKIVALFVWSIFIWAVSRKNSSAALEVLETRKQSYNEQIALLKRTHKKELSEKDKLIVEYHDIIEHLEEKFKEQEEQITEDHKKQIRRIVETSRDDPSKIRKRIENEFGFKFVD